MQFAAFLDNCQDVISYAKNFLAVNFKLDYVNAAGNIANYYPDFLVKLAGQRIVIVETKGREELDLPLKMQRLSTWCDDVNGVQSEVRYGFVFVDQAGFDTYKPKSFKALMEGFKDYISVVRPDG